MNIQTKLPVMYVNMQAEQKEILTKKEHFCHPHLKGYDFLVGTMLGTHKLFTLITPFHKSEFREISS